MTSLSLVLWPPSITGVNVSLYTEMVGMQWEEPDNDEAATIYPLDINF